jgi:hypothetical protein
MNKETVVAAQKVTTDYVLSKFVEIMDSDASWAIKVKALELMGKYLNMFVDQKKVNIDIKSIVARLSDSDLNMLAGGTVHDAIAAEIVDDTGTGNRRSFPMRNYSNSGIQLQEDRGNPVADD